jgi:hypothetical protein
LKAKKPVEKGAKDAKKAGAAATPGAKGKKGKEDTPTETDEVIHLSKLLNATELNQS